MTMFTGRLMVGAGFTPAGAPVKGTATCLGEACPAFTKIPLTDLCLKKM